jgi:hypothetical protein
MESLESLLACFVCAFCFLLRLTLSFSLCYQKPVVEEVVKTESVEPTPEAPVADEARELEATPEPEETPKEEEEAETPKENVESSAEETEEAVDTNAQKEAFSCCGIAVQ